MLDNQDVAILTKVNDLSERYGLKPYHFVATVDTSSEAGKTMLCFEIPAQGNALREERFSSMLHMLGADANGVLHGTTEQVIDALDKALQCAPRKRF